MKKILKILGILILLVFVMGATGCEKEGDLLKVKFYDANKNPISASTMSIVGGVPNVQYVEVTTIITNTGNIDLTNGLIGIYSAPNTIMEGFLLNNPKIYSVIIEPTLSGCVVVTGMIECSTGTLQQGENYMFSSGLINVDKIGMGTHKLGVYATGEYFDQSLGHTEMTKQINKEIILTIEPDIIMVCPPDTIYNAVTKICEPKKCMSNSDCVPSNPLQGIIYYCDSGECKTKPLAPSVNVEIKTS